MAAALCIAARLYHKKVAIQKKESTTSVKP
jgi:hypothetical protein